jgi:hypothetical protein
MSIIKIALDGKPLFNWEGDESKLRNIQENLPRGAAHVGLSPQQLASVSMAEMIKQGGILSGNDAASGMQMMAVIWYVLEQETGHPEHPGKLADYVGTVDFDVDIKPIEGGFTAHVSVTSKFDA